MHAILLMFQILGALFALLMLASLAVLVGAMAFSTMKEPRETPEHDAAPPATMPAPFGYGQRFATVDQLMPDVCEEAES